MEIDRDLNAAKNILNLGLAQIGLSTTDVQSGSNACGEQPIRVSMKQEKECLDNQANALFVGT